MRTGLKVLRVKNHHTQQDAAKALGVSAGTYNMVENGKREGSKEFWQKIQKLYKLDDGQVWRLIQNKEI